MANEIIVLNSDTTYRKMSSVVIVSDASHFYSRLKIIKNKE